ncbi:MAG TPA: hypothetical protein H9956_09065 [Candidatus Eisenbergiella pullicola]|nr:hypothetical protein [Candidatus Eisenbergiella pullicola]
MNYDALLAESDSAGLVVKEKPLKYNNGRIKRGKVAIRKDIPTSIEKTCILAEELGHYYTSSGDILDQQDISNRKQERRARVWAYDLLIGLSGIVKAYRHGCSNLYEMADYLEVTEEFLRDALERYRQKYGIYTTIDHHIIYFEPHLAIVEIL